MLWHPSRYCLLCAGGLLSIASGMPEYTGCPREFHLRGLTCWNMEVFQTGNSQVLKRVWPVLKSATKGD